MHTHWKFDVVSLVAAPAAALGADSVAPPIPSAIVAAAEAMASLAVLSHHESCVAPPLSQRL